MNVMQVINEQTSAWLTLAFADKDGAAVAPNSVNYRIDDMTNSVPVVALTTLLTPGASFQLELTPTINSIINQANFQEYKRLTVIAQYGVSDQITEQYDWIVNNLTFVT